MSLPIIIIGGGGHASVIYEILIMRSADILGYVAPQRSPSKLQHCAYLGDDAILTNYSNEEVMLANGLGSVSRPTARKNIFELFKGAGYRFTSVIHPNTVISSSAILSEGVQIMAGSIVQNQVVCADNVLVNTGAIIDHHCNIGAHTHVSVRAAICGNVTVGEECHLGAGSTIIQGVSVDEKCSVGAGAVVINDILSEQTVVGVPARRVG